MTPITDPGSLEGWTPTPASADELAHVVEQAFDYRGDVTVLLRDGSARSGYLFNRRIDVPDPYVELLESSGGAAPLAIRYADLRTIHFTGKDTAAGKSYLAWLERKAATRGA
ncbi:MAG: hypothetical protein HYR51_09015 [Candidatus Rokubacteria bacterium]|nr:hypothetical protein [Candidatus Rokubacteria bacterium]